MPNLKKHNYNQSAMVDIDFEEQLQPGTFEFTMHKLNQGPEYPYRPVCAKVPDHRLHCGFVCR